MRKLLLAMLCGVASADSTVANPQIDMQAYLKVAQEAAAYRQSHRLSEDEFLRMSREPGVIVLDARSRDKYDLLHIRGAVNLPFPDIAIESLARTLPNKKAKILIYCNNNFRNQERAFPAKAPDASLNVSTYISLYSYGYRNVWELGPFLDAKTTRLPLVPTQR
jgi:hypothetical protein